MKKAVLFLILGILLFSSIVFVLANGQGQGNQNESGGYYCNVDSDCVVKLNSCSCKNICANTSEFITCARACLENETDTSVQSCKCEDNKCVEKENETEDENETEEDEGTTVTKNKTRGEKRESFLPWQKRNESECPEDCKCRGAVVSCETEEGKTITIESGRSGNVITITIERTEEKAEVCEMKCEEECEEEDGEIECETECEEECEEVEVDTELELETETENNKTKLKAKLSNGRKAEVKIMPDTASERAIERLRLKVCSIENNCTIILKEVPVGKENETQLAYELQAERHYRILALFKTKAKVKAQINAETGEIIIVKKPWWAFLAREVEE